MKTAFPQLLICTSVLLGTLSVRTCRVCVYRGIMLQQSTTRIQLNYMEWEREDGVQVRAQSAFPEVTLQSAQTPTLATQKTVLKNSVTTPEPVASAPPPTAPAAGPKASVSAAAVGFAASLMRCASMTTMERRTVTDTVTTVRIAGTLSAALSIARCCPLGGLFRVTLNSATLATHRGAFAMASIARMESVMPRSLPRGTPSAELLQRTHAWSGGVILLPLLFCQCNGRRHVHTTVL